MNKLYKNFLVTLRVIGPLHIGSGEFATKKEYQFINESGKCKAEIFDFLNLLQLCEDSDDSEFQNYMHNPNLDLRNQLNKLMHKGISKKDIDSAIYYSIDCAQEFEDKDKHNLELFIKDINNKPYIPASSLKGALRTAIMSYEFSEFHGNINNILKNSKEHKNKQLIDNIMKNIYCYDSNWGDDTQLTTDDLFVCQAYDSNIDPDKDNLLPNFYEALKPNTTINMKISVPNNCIVRSKIDGDVSIDTEFFNKRIKHYWNTYYDKYLKYFDFEYVNDLCLLLGCRTGFASKTLHYFTNNDKPYKKVTTILKTQFKNKSRKLDNAKKLSPLMVKCTKVENSEPEQMGLCKFSVKEIN